MLGEENYTLDIRPTFIDELDAAVRYIERTFRNYQAADDLVAKADKREKPAVSIMFLHFAICGY